MCASGLKASGGGRRDSQSPGKVLARGPARIRTHLHVPPPLLRQPRFLLRELVVEVAQRHDARARRGAAAHGPEVHPRRGPDADEHRRLTLAHLAVETFHQLCDSTASRRLRRALQPREELLERHLRLGLRRFRRRLRLRRPPPRDRAARFADLTQQPSRARVVRARAQDVEQDALRLRDAALRGERGRDREMCGARDVVVGRLPYVREGARVVRIGRARALPPRSSRRVCVSSVVAFRVFRGSSLLRLLRARVEGDARAVVRVPSDLRLREDVRSRFAVARREVRELRHDAPRPPRVVVVRWRGGGTHSFATQAGHSIQKKFTGQLKGGAIKC